MNCLNTFHLDKGSQFIGKIGFFGSCRHFEVVDKSVFGGQYVQLQYAQEYPGDEYSPGWVNLKCKNWFPCSKIKVRSVVKFGPSND